MHTVAIVILFAATYLADDVLNRRLQLGQKLIDLWANDSSESNRGDRWHRPNRKG